MVDTAVAAGQSIVADYTEAVVPESAKRSNFRLRVVESGFDEIDWSDEEKSLYTEGHAIGWQTVLGRLRDHVASIRK